MSEEEKKALERAEKMEARLDALLSGMEHAKSQREEDSRMNRWAYFASAALQARFSRTPRAPHAMPQSRLTG